MDISKINELAGPEDVPNRVRRGTVRDCPACGYSLIGLPTKEKRCPECGCELCIENFVAGEAHKVDRQTLIGLLMVPGLGVVGAMTALAVTSELSWGSLVLFMGVWLVATAGLYNVLGKPGTRHPVVASALGLAAALALLMLVGRLFQ